MSQLACKILTVIVKHELAQTRSLNSVIFRLQGHLCKALAVLGQAVIFLFTKYCLVVL